MEKEQKKRGFNWKIFFIITAIVIFVSILYFWLGVNNSPDQSGTSPTPTLTSSQLEQGLIKASDELNKDLPKTIDSVTKLFNTTAIGKELHYKYEIDTKYKFSQTDLAKAKDKLALQLCSTPDTKEFFNMGATYVFNYYYADGKFIGKISIKGSDCTKITPTRQP